MTETDRISAQFPSDRIGIPGIQQVLWVSPLLEGEGEEAAKAKLDDRSLREFKVICSFSKTISFDGSDGGIKGDDDGTSNLSLPHERYAIRCGIGEIYFAKNESGLLSTAYARFKANSLNDAHSRFIEHLSPLIDWLSFVGAIPFHVHKVHCFDLVSNAQLITVTPSYPTIEMPVVEMGVLDEMVPIYSLYREAKSTLNPYYQCICYFKILEGAFDEIRHRLFKAAKKLGIELERPSEKVPDNDVIPELSGKSIQEVKQTHFTKEYRTAMSHFNLTGRPGLVLSRLENREKFNRAVHVLDLCVRVVIPNLDRQLRAFVEATKQHPAQSS